MLLHEVSTRNGQSSSLYEAGRLRGLPVSDTGLHLASSCLSVCWRSTPVCRKSSIPRPACMGRSAIGTLGRSPFQRTLSCQCARLMVPVVDRRHRMQGVQQGHQVTSHGHHSDDMVNVSSAISAVMSTPWLRCRAAQVEPWWPQYRYLSSCPHGHLGRRRQAGENIYI